MNFEVGKTYLTRSGAKAVVISLDANEPQPIVALFEGEPNVYTKDGAFFTGRDNQSGLDLVSEYVEPPKPREVWVTVYPDGDYGLAYKKPNTSPESVGLPLVKFREVIEA